MSKNLVITFVFMLINYCLEAQTSDTIWQQLKINKINDTITAIGKYEDNRKQGQWVFFKNGSIAKIANFTRDTLSGKAYYFNKDGILIREAEFRSGRLNGLTKFYSNVGELIAIYEYTNSIKGKTKYYKIHPEGPPKNHSFRPEY